MRYWRELLLLSGVVLSGFVRADETVTDGSLPVYSPDGLKLAFQRETPEGVRLGVCDLKTKAVSWVGGSPGHAAQAAWHPTDGSLVYVCGNETQTAKEGFFAKDQTGWNLRIWRAGVSVPLTSGRFWDYTPSFSPDGQFVYFASTRVPVAPGMSSGTVLYRVPTSGGKPEQLTDYAGNSSGISMPSVSPDGKRLVWAALNSAFDAWYLAVARTAAPRRSCRVSSPGLVAYSPRWSPDGKYICCTGIRAGDPGWMVYVVNPLTGAERRLFAGREPAFSPDGRKLAYSAGGKIFEHALGPEDWPIGGAVPGKPEMPPAHALLKASAAKAGDRFAMSPDFAFRDDKTFYVRFKGLAPRQACVAGAQCAFAGRYAESALGFQVVFHNGGICTFALRTKTGEYFGLQSNRRIAWGSPVEIVCVRHGDSAYVSVNGSELLGKTLPGTLDLKTPQFVEVMPPYHGAAPTCRIDELEVGAGWPKGLPVPATPGEMFE